MVKPPKISQESAKPARKRKRRASPAPVETPAVTQVRYTPEIATAVCLALMEGLSLRAACEGPDMPNPSTVYRWLLERDDFREQYARAREVQAEGYVDEMLEIADDGRNDWMERQQGGYEINREVLARSGLRLEARKWIAVKLIPKKYGDRTAIDVTHGVEAMDDAELAAEVAAQLRALGIVLLV